MPSTTTVENWELLKITFFQPSRAVQYQNRKRKYVDQLHTNTLKYFFFPAEDLYFI